MKKLLLLFFTVLFTLNIYAQCEPATTYPVVAKLRPTNSYPPEGGIDFAFSISETKQVYFSKGNLQYQASTGTWRFAEHQYDVIRDGKGTISGSNNNNASSTYSGWIDIFGYGTSGYNGKNPYMTSTTDADYYYSNLTGNVGSMYDWGVYNAISNGGNKAGLWRTLTSTEWGYLLTSRFNASNLRQKVFINVNSIYIVGVVLMPDNWIGTLTANTIYTPAQFALLEAEGAVFLPADGWCSGSTWYSNGATISGKSYVSDGGYWTATGGGTSSITYIQNYDNSDGYQMKSNSRPWRGYCVRLVHDK